MQVAEGVHEARFQQARHLLPLLVGEAGVLPVRLRVLQVDLLMRHVQVPAEHHGLLRVQFRQPAAEVVLPPHPVVQPFQAVLGVGHVGVDEEEVPELRGDDPALVIVLVHAHAVRHVQGRHPGVDRGARVALLLRVVPERVVAVEGKVQLPGLHLRLLQAEDVRVQGAETVREALSGRRPQSVHVPGDQFHPSFSLRSARRSMHQRNARAHLRSGSLK